MNNCIRCGTAVADGAAFCANCGAQVTDPGGATVAIAIGQEDKLLTQLRQELASDYRVERELGRGGMAIVYKAVELGLERTVALKVVPPEMSVVGNTADRFKREAKMAASLDHPNIIPVYRVGQTGQLFYMAMKFIEGRAVDAILESQGALPMPVVMNVLRCASSALAFAHEHGIVHRDIKGANILVDKDGRVVVSDFGIARAMEDKSLTASGMVIGTPYFMSPEQCGGTKVGPQSDQYSLGIVAFQLLTGSVPFEADSMMGIIQHHYLTPVPDITNVREGVPEVLLDIVYRSLNKDPKDRFETSREMAEAIAAIPESDEDRKEGERLMRVLSHGEKIPQVRTGSLPPLTLSSPATMTPIAPAPKPRPATQPPTPAVAPAHKSNTGMLVGIAAAVVIAVGGMGAYVLTNNKAPATAPSAALVTANPNAMQNSAAVTAPKDSTGTVQFLGSPRGARITIDGRNTLTSPQAILTVGPHTWSASLSGYESSSGILTVKGRENVNVSYNLSKAAVQTQVAANPTPSQAAPAPAFNGAMARVSVGAEPLSAEIFVDGKRIGVGRVLNAAIPAGSHTLKVSAPGYDTETKPFSVEPDGTASLGKITLKQQG